MKSRWRLVLGMATAMAAVPAIAAATPSGGDATGGRQAGAVHALVVTGVSGEPRFAARFNQQATGLIDALTTSYGVPAARIRWLGEHPAAAAGRMAGRATRDAVSAELARLAGLAGPDDLVLIVFIGHGSDDGEPKLNLPGPDLAAGDLRSLLDRLGNRLTAVVFASSASGGMVPALAAPRRVVITATKSGLERNETLFGEAFVAALGGAAADTDKDRRLSLAEAYAWTTSEVERVYTSSNRLQTEHARVSDTTLARQFILVPVGVAVSADPADSVGRALVARKAELEREIEALRARRASLPADQYEAALEELVLELARVNRDLRERSGRP